MRVSTLKINENEKVPDTIIQTYIFCIRDARKFMRESLTVYMNFIVSLLFSNDPLTDKLTNRGQACPGRELIGLNNAGQTDEPGASLTGAGFDWFK